MDAREAVVGKSAPGTTTTYGVDGERIVYEKTSGQIKRYFYDESGIAGMYYQGAYWYFRKNLQGDVVGICNASGTLIGEYVYDAWGNLLEEPESGIMKDNPFRYRGYYYDTSIGLYYLNSRYYDPETGRFLNEDLVSYLAPETIGGINLYAYCLNDPVNNIDPSGHFVFGALLLGSLIGFAVGVAGSMITQLVYDHEINWGIALIDGAFGAISGLLVATGLGAIATGFANAGLTAVNMTLTTGLGNGWDFTEADIAAIALTSITSGVFSGIQRVKFIRSGGLAKVKENNRLAKVVQGRISDGTYYKRGGNSQKSAWSAVLKGAKEIHLGPGYKQDCAATIAINFLGGISKLDELL